MVRRPFAKRKHAPGFKLEAVRLMQERLASGLTLQRVAEELEIHPDLLRLWARQVRAAPAHASPEEIFPGHGRRRPFAMQTAVPPSVAETTEEELRRLRRENERLRLERDILKKAAAFFAKESQ